MLGGWLFEPTKEGSRVTLIVCLDLKGMIPGWVIAQVTKTQPLSIAKMGAMLDKEFQNSGCSSREDYVREQERAGGYANATASEGEGSEGEEKGTPEEVSSPEKAEYDRVKIKLDDMIQKAVLLAKDASPQWTLMFEHQGKTTWVPVATVLALFLAMSLVDFFELLTDLFFFFDDRTTAHDAHDDCSRRRHLRRNVGGRR